MKQWQIALRGLWRRPGYSLTAVALGIGMTIVAERLLKTMLFGVSPLDPWTLACAIGLLTAVSLIAAVLPAQRAAAVDPLDAIRAE